MAFSGKNPRFTSTLLTDALATTPSSPPSGAAKMLNRNGALFLMDNNGIETPVGGGAGEKNYILSPSSAVGWVASGAGITVAVDTTAAELPRGLTTKSGIKITGVSGSTAYAYYRFTLDQVDYNRKLKIKLDLRPISGYVASDMKIDLYSNTASNYGGTSARVVTSSDASSIFAIPNATGQLQTSVDMPGSTAPYMELRIGLNASSTQAIVVSDVVVGPGIQPQGVIVTEWLSYTPVWVNAPGTKTGFWRRVGSDMEVKVLNLITGAVTGRISVALPTGFTINTAAMTGVGNTSTNSGMAEAFVAGAAYYAGTINYDSSTTVRILNTLSGGDYWGTLVPNTWANGDVLSATFKVPISEWAGSGNLNVVQNDVEYVSNSTTSDAADTTAFAYGPSGSLVPGTLTAARKKRVSFNTPIQSTDTLVVELQPGGTGSWIPITFQDAADNVSNYSLQNAKTYGVGLVPVSATTLDVIFGQYSAPTGATFDSAGTAWGSVTASTRYRVRKYSSGQAVGFGNVAQSTSGLVKSAGQLLGTNTNDVAAAGYVGEYVENVRSSASPNITTNTYCSIDSGNATFNDGAEVGISLTAGDWDISANAVFTGAASDLPTQVETFIGTAVGASATGQDIARAYQGVNVAVAAGGLYSEVLSKYRVSISVTTVYYLKCRVVHTVGTVSAKGCISARRVR